MTDTTLTGREARRRLSEVMRRDDPFEEKVRAALQLGVQYLGVDNGHLTRIDSHTDHWRVVVTTDATGDAVPQGLELDLEETYCRRAIEGDSPFTIHDVVDRGLEDDPAYERLGFGCYLGTPLRVNGEVYGAVCFVAESPRADPFDDSESMFAELVARMLEREFEHEQFRSRLTRHTNMVNVLNRVLRHNLRTDMNIIRGYTSMLADEAQDEEALSVVLDRIDKVVSLCEKARQLDWIAAQDTAAQTTEIENAVEAAVMGVESRFPTASISVDIDGDARGTAVYSSVVQAIEELVENAAKHGGEAPQVHLRAERSPDAVEVYIADDGPGLPDHEQRVFEAGVETPLVHGSGLGLWTAYWIVSSHGGTIDVKASAEGTTVVLSIPHRPEMGTGQVVAELRRARDLYEAAFEEAFDAIVIADDGAQVVEANRSTADVYGVSREEILGRSLAEFLPDDFDFEAEWRSFQQAGGNRDVVTAVGGDGVDRTVEYSGAANIVPGLHLFISRCVSAGDAHDQSVTDE